MTIVDHYLSFNFNVILTWLQMYECTYYIFLSLFVKLAFHSFFLSDKGSRLQDHMALLWDTGYQTTICKHWHLWLIIIFGQFLEGLYQGFYQYQPFCWNFIKVLCTYHKLGKRRDFSVYVLKINAQEWRHARGILEYANTTIQWNPRYNEKGLYILFFRVILYFYKYIYACRKKVY